jgi:hypothetical protein
MAFGPKSGMVTSLEAIRLDNRQQTYLYVKNAISKIINEAGMRLTSKLCRRGTPTKATVT